MPWEDEKNKKCPKCGHTEFGVISEQGYDFIYCRKCMTSFDEDGNELPEGDESWWDDPDHERDIKEG